MDLLHTIIFALIITESSAYLEVNTIISQIENGPLKDVIQNHPKGWFFKTDVEKSVEYILDVLQRTHSVDVDKPMTTLRGYWGEITEILGLVENNRRMNEAIANILPDKSEEIKQQEFKKISVTYEKIKNMWKEFSKKGARVRKEG